jgi:hypothetical protein
LEDVRATAAERERSIEDLASLGDLVGVPELAVLVVQQDQLAVAKTRLAPRVVQQHHRQETVDLGLVRQQLSEGARQPDRFCRELVAAAVPLVEDEIDDGQDGVDTLLQQLGGRHAERDAGGLDLALGPDEPLGHRALRDQKGACDLIRGESAERAQRERDLRLDVERRMATREDELQPLVRKRRRSHRRLAVLVDSQQRRLGFERAVAPDVIDGAVARRRDEPRARTGRNAVARPALGGDRERLLRDLLGEVEVAKEADQGGHDAAPFLAEDLAGRRYQETSEGRISTVPP